MFSKSKQTTSGRLVSVHARIGSKLGYQRWWPKSTKLVFKMLLCEEEQLRTDFVHIQVIQLIKCNQSSRLDHRRLQQVM